MQQALRHVLVAVDGLAHRLERHGARRGIEEQQDNALQGCHLQVLGILGEESLHLWVGEWAE